MFVVASFVLAMLSAASSTTLDHAHDLDKQLKFYCPKNQMISQVTSDYHDSHLDRLWGFKCSYAPVGASLDGCAWSGYVNEFQQPGIYQCHDGGVLAGWFSIHENRPTEDRRMKFRCCKPKGYLAHSCKYVNLNYFQETLNYKVPDGYVITGVFSYFSEEHTDRRYSFNVCALDLAESD